MPKKIGFIIAAIIIAIFVTGCGSEVKTQSVEKQDAKYQEKTQEKLKKKIGNPKVDDSLELRNMKKRYELLDDKNKTGYVYLISHGLIFAQYTVKGKVSSMNSQFTNPQKLVKADYGEGWESNVLPQAEPDGSYGENPEGIFFFTTDNIYVEWAGDYMYSDERIVIQQPSQNLLTKKVK